MTTSANFPNRPFRLEQRNAIYNQTPWNGGNSNLVHSELWIIKNSYSPSFSASGSSYSVYVSSNLVGSNGNFGYDFRNSDSLLLHASDNWFAADSGGYMYYTVYGYCNAAILGYAETGTGYNAPRIPRPAAAPTPYPTVATAVKNPTASSLMYQFSGNDLGGGTLLRWEIEYATNPSFTGSTIVSSSGTSTLDNLASGTTYYFRSRAVTTMGNGAWSVASSGSTLPSVKVSDGTSWLSPTVLVSNGTVWVSPQVLISTGSAWVTPATT